MSEQQPNDKLEAAPNSEPTPKPYTKESLPRIIDLPPSGRVFVIGGVSGFTSKPTEPDLHQPTPEEVEEARRDRGSDDGESKG